MEIDLDKMLGRYADAEALEGLALRFEEWEDNDGATWMRDFSNRKFFDTWKRNEMSQWNYERSLQRGMSIGSRRTPDDYDSFTYIDQSFLQIKAQYKYVYDCREFLMDYQNFVHRFTEYREIDSSENSFVQNVIDFTKETFPNWRVLTSTGICNRWCHQKGKRIQHEITSWKLENLLSNTYADFHTGSLDEDGVLNLMMFEVVDQSRHGNGFKTIKEFKDVTNMLMHLQSSIVRGFTSIALIEDHISHTVPNGSWRFEIYDDEKFSDVNKLTRFWLGLGGCLGREMFEDSDWSRIYFWNKNEARRIKEKSVELKLPNPFRGLKKSIYDEEFEKFLLM
jgi:hypothetical protein